MNDFTPSEPIDVLLVEDNPGDVRLTREAFESIDSAIEFHIVSDGEAVTKYFDIGNTDEPVVRPDIILLDLNLPKMDGFTVLEILERELEHPPPPILILSSSQTEEDIVESYDRAANAYLSKPSDPEEYVSIAKAIERFWIDSVQHPPAPS